MLCKSCELRPGEYQPSLWFQHIWFLYCLRQGGYPFEKDDLTIEEWLDIGVLSRAAEGLEFKFTR